MYTNFNLGLSSPDSQTTLNTATTVFSSVSDFVLGGNDNFTDLSNTGEVWNLIHARTNIVQLSAPNNDTDRGPIDQEWFVDKPVGQIIVTDNDTNGPIYWLVYIGTNYTPGATSTNVLTDKQMLGGLQFCWGMWDASGIFLTNEVAGATNVDGKLGNVDPNWDIVEPNGVQLQWNSIPPPSGISSPFGNGSLNATVVIQNVTAVNYNNNTVGVWRLQISAQDMDADRGYYLLTNAMGIVNTVSWDRAVSSDQPLGFTVVDDDTNPPTVGNAANGYPMSLWIGSTNYPATGSGTNAYFTLTDGDLTQISGDNLLLNPGMETDGWYWVRWGSGCDFTNAGAQSGSWCMRLEGPDNNGNYETYGGCFQDVGSVTAGELVVFSVYARKEAGFTNGDVQLRFEYRDGTDVNEVGRSDLSIASSLTTNWQKFTYQDFVSNGAYYVRTVFAIEGVPTNSGSNARVYGDNAYLTRDYPPNPLRIVFSVYEPLNGVSRELNVDSADPSQVMNASLGTWAVNDTTHFVPYESSRLADSFASSATSVWMWTHFTSNDVQALYNAGTSTVTATVPNNDNDRVGDREFLQNQQFGFIKIIDEDPQGPIAYDLQIKNALATVTNVTDKDILIGNWKIQLTFADKKGISTNSSGWWWGPNFCIINSIGATVLQNYAFQSFSVSGTNTYAWKDWAGVIDYTNNMTGVWQVAWSAQDTDIDRSNSVKAVTNSRSVLNTLNLFTVVDDFTNPPIPPTSLVTTPNSWTNVNLFTVNWTPAQSPAGIAESAIPADWP